MKRLALALILLLTACSAPAPLPAPTTVSTNTATLVPPSETTSPVPPSLTLPPMRYADWSAMTQEQKDAAYASLPETTEDGYTKSNASTMIDRIGPH